MVFGSFQAVDVLMLVGNVAPIALYFLVLGLVNSHSRPFMTTRRSDFVMLTTVLVPVLLWPVPTLAGAHRWWPLVGGVAIAAVFFIQMLPKMGTGYVVYNVSEETCSRLLQASLGALRLQGRWHDGFWYSDSGELTLHLRKFPLLRNVTLHIDARSPGARRMANGLGDELHGRLERVSQLPSTMGACLVLIGLGLLILPMWMVGRHIQDLVDAMSHVFG